MSGIEAKFYGRAETTTEMLIGQSGARYARMKVAVSQPPDGDGNFSEIWISVTCFGGLAETITGEVVKGQQVYCEGVLTVSMSAKVYKKSYVNLKATSVELVENKGAKQENRREPLADDRTSAPQED